MENPIKMDDLGGFSIIFGNTHVSIIGFPPNKMLQLLASSEEQLCKASPAYPLAHLQPWLVFW